MTKKEFLEKLSELLKKDKKNEIWKLIGYYKEDSKTSKRQNAAYWATEVRTKRVKEKIQNAINLLNLENKAITPYQVAKTAGISYNTAKRHLKALYGQN